MPMIAARYPENWPALAREVKEAADWACMVCGLQCRRPGEAYDTMRRTLTVAHWDHDYFSAEIYVVACCPACHLRHDARAHAAARSRTRTRSRRQAGQTSLLRLAHSELSAADVAELSAAWPSLDELWAGLP